MQVIKYKWMNFEKRFQPFLFAKNGEGFERMQLLDRDISFSVSDRKCIGYFSAGRHVNCPGNRTVERDWNCNECRLSDDFFLCIQCTGDECINRKQRPSCETTKYFVYLAAFDSVLKVGISNERRLMERLIEQGADFGAKIAEITDGKEVRLVEQEIKSSLDITDKVTGTIKQDLIFGNPNTEVRNIMSAISALQNNGVSKHLIQPEIFDLRAFYGLQNVPAKPKKMRIRKGDRIDGRAVAAKGNIVIIENSSGFSSFNAHDLIGCEINYDTITVIPGGNPA